MIFFWKFENEVSLWLNFHLYSVVPRMLLTCEITIEGHCFQLGKCLLLVGQGR